MDIQYVADSCGLLSRYITLYMSKFEKGATTDVWNTIERIEGEDLRNKLYCVINEVVKKREVGIPEIVDHLLQFDTVKFTEGDRPTFINLTPPAYRFRRLPGIFLQYVQIHLFTCLLISILK